jgi:hypothetical protein
MNFLSWEEIPRYSVCVTLRILTGFSLAKIYPEPVELKTFGRNQKTSDGISE